MRAWWILLLVPAVQAYETTDPAGDQAIPDADHLDILSVILDGNDTLRAEVLFSGSSDQGFELFLRFNHTAGALHAMCDLPEGACRVQDVSGTVENPLLAAWALEGDMLWFEVNASNIAPAGFSFYSIEASTRVQVDGPGFVLPVGDAADDLVADVDWPFQPAARNETQGSGQPVQPDVRPAQVGKESPGLPLWWLLPFLRGVRR